MRALTLGFAAVAMAFAVSACSAKSGAVAPVKTTPAELEKHIETLSRQPFKMDAQGPADIASVRDALPKAVSLTWASLDFDAATGATVLKDVKLTPADMPRLARLIARALAAVDATAAVRTEITTWRQELAGLRYVVDGRTAAG